MYPISAGGPVAAAAACVEPAWVTPDDVYLCCGETSGHHCDITLDGLTYTDWQCNGTHLHWIIYDLGATKLVLRIKLYLDTTDTWANICRLEGVYINDTHDLSGGSKASGNFGEAEGWFDIAVTPTCGRYIYLQLKTYDGSVPGVCGSNDELQNFFEFEAQVV